MRASQQGFSLIEIAVVLAIIGLVIGGIMGGTKLLAQSRLQGVLAQASSYAMSIDQFRQQYGELPGDFSQANRVWSQATNGNGDNIWGTASAGGGVGENYQIWRQLVLAGYLAGNYSGVAGANNANHVVPGVNAPAGSVRNSVFWHHSWGPVSGHSSFYDGDYNNAMVFGGSVDLNWPSAGVITGRDAYDIDKKADDSLPGQGAIRTFSETWYGGTCVSGGNNAVSGAYNRRSNGCVLLFMQDFGKKTRI